MFDFLTENRIPVGDWAEAATNALIKHGSGFFDALSATLKFSIDGILNLLEFPNPLVFIALLVAIAWWRRRSISFCIFAGLAFLLIYNLGYWKEMIQTLSMVMASAFICMAIGVPLGIMAAHRPVFSAAIRPLLDLMQTVPTFVYLIPALILFGLGMVPGLVATVIFALPASIRLTELGVKSTPRELFEAGQAFGATPMQMLTKVELPHAAPQIMAGLTQTIMLSLSMVVVAALVGAPGLGVPVVRALNSVNIGMGFEAGLVIVLLAIVLDRLLRSEQGHDGRNK